MRVRSVVLIDSMGDEMGDTASQERMVEAGNICGRMAGAQG